MPDAFFDRSVPARAAAKWTPFVACAVLRAPALLIAHADYLLFDILASANLMVPAAPRQRCQRSGNVINAMQ